MQLLIDHRIIKDAQVQEVIDEQTRTGNPIRRIVIDLGLIKEDDLLVLIASNLGTSVVKLAERKSRKIS